MANHPKTRLAGTQPPVGTRPTVQVAWPNRSHDFGLRVKGRNDLKASRTDGCRCVSPSSRAQGLIVPSVAEDGAGMEMAYRERWEAEIAEMRRVLAGFEMKEVCKWGKPTYTVDGKNI